MDIFHVVFDTSLLRETPFGHPGFTLLLRRVQQGVAKLYIPFIVLEERRTQLLDDYDKVAALLKNEARKLQKGNIGMIYEGLRLPNVDMPTRAEVDQNLKIVIDTYLTTHKIEVLDYTFEHATNTVTRYFSTRPPFNPAEDRVNRRRDIPDAWILEAALDIKKRPGRHCVLVSDLKLRTALISEGIEPWDDIEKLNAEIGLATAVTRIEPAVASAAAVPLDRLRSKDFDNVDRILLGMNEALGTPDKQTLFSKLEVLGIRRDIAEHEAKTLELSGTLDDFGGHLIPTNRETARHAEKDSAVQALLLRLLDDGL